MDDNENVQAEKNLNNVLSSSAALSNKTGLFIYSAINAIFDKQINALLSLKSLPAGAKEAWQAWTKVSWLDKQDYESITNDGTGRWPDNSTLQAALQATGQLVLNVLSLPSISTDLDKKLRENVTSFVEDVNPKVSIVYWLGEPEDMFIYQSGDKYYTIEHEIVNIMDGFKNNDFRQIGEAFGLLVNGVMSSS